MISNRKNGATKNGRKPKRELVVKQTGNAMPWEAAMFLGWSERQLAAAAERGEIPCNWMGSHRRYAWEMLHAFIRNDDISEFYPQEENVEVIET